MRVSLYISGASLLESVIAISIISGCLLVGLKVFASVNNTTPPKEFYAQKFQRGQFLASMTLEDKGVEELNIESTVDQETPYGKLVENEITYGDDQSLIIWTFKTDMP